MKRIIVTISLMIASIIPLMAQYDKEQDIAATLCLQLNHYETGWNKFFRTSLMLPVSEKCRLGGGAYYGGAHSYIELMRESVPFDELRARRFDMGICLYVQYMFVDNNRGRQSLILQLSGGLSGIDFNAEDERAEHWVSGENSDYISYSYNIIPTNDEYWGPCFQITPQISYAYDWNIFHFEFGVGYDIINLIRSKYLSNPTKLSSSWDEYNIYYPEIMVNPFKEWECGRDLAGRYGISLSFSLGINLFSIGNNENN